MPLPAKRGLTSIHRSVSPPALRKKLDHVADVPTESQANCVSEDRSLSTSDSLRVVSWNVNGVGPFLQKRLQFQTGTAASQTPLREVLRRHKWPQLLCLQEVKIRNGDDVTLRQLRKAANANASSGEPTYEITFSLPRDEFNATGFGGKVHGVASLIKSDFLSKVKLTKSPAWDLEGRILVHELQCGLVVINGYWVNGTSAPYRNPKTGLPDGDRHDLKLRYHKHLLEETLRYQGEGKYVVLVGDMNVAPDYIDGYPNLRTNPLQHVRNRQDFNDNFFIDPDGMRGVDVFRRLRGKQKKYTYHSPHGPWGASMDRVDLVIASRELVNTAGAVVDCDICDNQADIGHSDHVPLFIIVDLSKIEHHGRIADTTSTEENTSIKSTEP